MAENGDSTWRGVFRAPYEGFWLIALAFALEGCAGQYRTLSTYAGVQGPASIEGVAARVLTFALALAVLLYARRERASFIFEGKAWGIATASVFSVGLALEFAPQLFAFSTGELSFGWDILIAASAYLCLFVWFDRLLALGLTNALLTIAMALLLRGLLQTGLLLLRDVPAIFVLTVMPLLSLPGFLQLYAKTQEDGFTAEQGSGILSGMDAPRARAALAGMLLIALLASCASTLLQEQSRSVAAALADSGTLSQTVGVAANLIVGVAMYAIARRHAASLGLLAAMVSWVTFAAVALYTSAVTDGALAAVYSLMVALCMRLGDFAVLYAAFTFATPGNPQFEKHVYVRLAVVGGYLISNIAIVGPVAQGAVDALRILLFPALIASLALFAASVYPAFAQKKTDAATGGATDADAPTARRRLFQEAIEKLADECGLTTTERTVLHLAALGMNAESIAQQLTVSANTAKTHIRNIYAKTNVHSQQELILRLHEIKESLRTIEQ